MSAPFKDLGDLLSRTLSERSPTVLEMDLREALVLWLRWNEAYERVTERLYDGQFGSEQTETVLDEVESLRREAVRLSQELLD